MYTDLAKTQAPSFNFGIGNTSRQLNERAEEAAKNFAGLPEGVSHWDALLVLKRAKPAGLTGTLTSHLEFLMGYTRLQDWQAGSSPVVYLTVSAIASRRGISERQVLNIERALNRLGLLCWHDNGNKRRYGHRSADGELKEAYGVNLAPLAALFNDLSDIVEGQEQRARIWKEHKQALLLHKRVLREKLTLMPEHPACEPARQLLLSLPRRIEARFAISRLVSWSKQILNLIASFDETATERGEGVPLEDTLSHAEADEMTSSDEAANTSGRQKTSDRSEIKFRHINTNNTNKTLSNERSNASPKRTLPFGNDMKSCETANAEMALEKIKRERHASARQLAFELEDTVQTPLPCPSRQHCFASGIEHISLKQVLACSSPLLQEMIRAETPAGGPDWKSVIAASKLAASYLGISKPAWQEACHKLGASAAATLIMIAERRSTDTQRPINSYGGFLRGCLARAEAGDLHLHLHKSVFGLLNKANLNEQTRAKSGGLPPQTVMDKDADAFKQADP